MLAGRTKAAGLGLVRFLTMSGHAFRSKAICCYLFSGPKSHEIRTGRSGALNLLHHQKNINYQICFKAQQTRKAAPKASEN